MLATRKGRQAIQAMVAAEVPEHPPGTHSVYSDLGFILLDQVIQRVAGKTLDALFRQRIARRPNSSGLFFVDLTRPAAARAVRAGRVFAATLYQSEVELLTDQNAAAGAVLFHTRLSGIVQGTGDENLSLNFISISEDVPDNELVFTSGTDRIYPKGLPIGTIISSEKEDVYQRIIVRPQVDLSRLEEVMVVLNGKGEGHRNEEPRKP
jgi:hypothetical protein